MFSESTLELFVELLNRIQISPLAQDAPQQVDRVRLAGSELEHAVQELALKKALAENAAKELESTDKVEAKDVGIQPD